MKHQLTFSIIKPDAMKRNIAPDINKVLQTNGLTIVAQKIIHMTKKQAEKFYEIHKERPFFQELVEFMTSYPVTVQVLSGDSAVEAYRNIMGDTNPDKAKEGTIRKLFGLSIGENSVHGSDSIENAEKEIAQFFSKDEIFTCLDKSKNI